MGLEAGAGLPGGQEEERLLENAGNPKPSSVYAMGILGTPNNFFWLIGEHFSVLDLANFGSTCHRLSYVLVLPLYRHGNESPDEQFSNGP